MDFYNLALFFIALILGIFTFYAILMRINGWYYAIKFCSNKYNIPNGYMGLPYFGNTLSYFKASMCGDPKSFIDFFATRFGEGGMYRAYIFGKPTIMVTKPEIIRKVLMDEEYLERGLPNYMKKLIGLTTSIEEDKYFRRLTAPVKSHGLLSDYFDYIDKTVSSTLEKYATTEEPVEFLHKMHKLTFEVFMRLLIGDEVNQELFDEMFEEITAVISGVHNLPINLPGFAYHKGLKARKVLGEIFKKLIDERREAMKDGKSMPKANIIDMLLSNNNQDYEANMLSDKKIIEILVLFSFAGFEPVALMSVKAIFHLQKHPHFLEKAKEEQEEIVKRRASSNAGLSFDEIRQMTFVSKIINETLRIATDQSVFLRDTSTTFNINGYTIPKGWKFFAVVWNIHMNPDVYVQPKEFNPSRWDDIETKPGIFLPFSMGPKSCPGSNLAKLQISVILHYYLLHYRVEQINPEARCYPPENCLVKFKKLSISSNGN